MHLFNNISYTGKTVLMGGTERKLNELLDIVSKENGKKYK